MVDATEASRRHKLTSAVVLLEQLQRHLHDCHVCGLGSWSVPAIVVEAYGLTPREREVVRGIARGLSTPDIAGELFLSSHTVRDYIKSVFEKVGVSSRGELTAKLFAEH